MKKILIHAFLLASLRLFAQTSSQQHADIVTLIDNYSKAREQKDTILLKKILTPDVDQLVSTGVWRTGMREAILGMLRSTESNNGSRKLIVDKVRFLSSDIGLV